MDPDDQRLASRLEQGLQSMHQSGELLQFMRQHPVTRHVFDPGRYSRSIVFKLHNPVLPALHKQKKQNQSDDWLQLLQIKQKP